jgi:hypothetical protein
LIPGWIFLFPVVIRLRFRLLFYCVCSLILLFFFLLIRGLTLARIPDAPRIEVNEVTNRPGFVGSLQAFSDLGKVCVEVDQGVIWEPGDHAGELWRHILANTEFQIESRFINYERPVFGWATLTVGFNTNGQVAGDYGGAMGFCYIVNGLPTGSYNSSIRVVSRSGVEHTYVWSITVED